LDDNITTRIGEFQTRAFIAGIRGVTTGANDAVAVFIDSNGQLGTVSSSLRYKEDVSDMGAASGRLMDLNPVTFRYKDTYANGDKPLQYGLIAEEVAKVFPDLVVFNDKGQPETVKYRLLSILLLNELQKQNEQLVSLNGRVAELDELRGEFAELNQLVQRMAHMNGLLADKLVASRSVE
ncbi:MAG: tail fiber domain-containing protein, partial [Gammaproteobacteria bacterium]|nr:tail fiber domain-containing protein [Gammaproteobacteria bacterium]